MRLRRATTEDFAVSKDLYNDSSADMLYNNINSAEESQKFENGNLFAGLADIMPKEYHQELLQHFFEQDDGLAYVFEDDDENIIGFVGLLKITAFRWKLAKISVESDYQTLEVLTEIVEALLKEKQSKELDVSTPLQTVQEWLKKIGFKSIKYPDDYSYMRIKRR